jgi:hypothetical protein
VLVSGAGRWGGGEVGKVTGQSISHTVIWKLRAEADDAIAGSVLLPAS